MIINQKIEIKFDKESSLILDSQSRMCSKLYNILLENCKKEYEETGQNKLLTGRNLRDLVVDIKQEHAYLYSVHSSPLKNTAFRLKNAYEKYFKSLKDKTYDLGYPKFHSYKKKWFSLLYDEPNKGIRIENKHIRISLGYKLDEKGKKTRLYVNGILDEKIKVGNVKTYRITKELNKYYLIVTIEVSYKIKERKENKIISIDPNHTNFFVGIDNEGKTIELGKLYLIKYFDKQIDKVKSKRDKCLKKSKTVTNENGTSYNVASKRYQSLDKALSKLYLKRKNQLKTALFTIAHKLCDEYTHIVIGDYVPTPDLAKYHTMARAMLNQSPIGQFRSILQHVSAKRGCKFEIVYEAYTTMTCSVCGDICHHEPNEREFLCPCCNTKLYRDINSAINIGVKAKVLSSSDYKGIDLSKPLYTANYNLRKQRISGWN